MPLTIAGNPNFNHCVIAGVSLLEQVCRCLHPKKKRTRKAGRECVQDIFNGVHLHDNLSFMWQLKKHSLCYKLWSQYSSICNAIAAMVWFHMLSILAADKSVASRSHGVPVGPNALHCLVDSRGMHNQQGIIKCRSGDEWFFHVFFHLKDSCEFGYHVVPYW